ncbi:MAG: chromosomal replication initiator protein DnaA [Elusimicrobiota bacterium]|nr:chromosomal replication initiator protein DnaA [Elusimicrobiota bacterium]
MTLKNYSLEPAPSPKDKNRYKLNLEGSEDDVNKIVKQLSGISSRPFPSPEPDFDWALFLYDLKAGVRDKISSELDRVIKLKKDSPNKQEKNIEIKDKDSAPQLKLETDSSGLRKGYTFDKFVVGTNTRFTYAACKAVADKPGKNYNPLFVYGGVGLGKTHLMQAIGHHVKQNFPEMKVVYISCGKFINEVVEAIEKGTINKLRNQFKNVDLLLIDDIQFLEQSESTQEEFFHIFNDMHEVEKQIILTSDKPPKKLATLEDRLKSRFEWGLTTDVKSPNFETRKAILKKKASEADLELPDDINNFIAERLTSNIRELEGIINRIVAYQELSAEEETVNVSLIKDIMRNILPEDEDETAQKEEEERKEKQSAAPSPTPPERQPPGYNMSPPPGQQRYGNRCPRCGVPLNYIQQYQRWYCNNCGVYTDPASSAPLPPGNYQGYYPPPASTPPPPPRQQASPKRPCPECSTPLKYIDEYDRYYCPNCKEYEQELIKQSDKPKPKKDTKKKTSPAKGDKGPSGEEENEIIENIIIGKKSDETRVIKAGYFIAEGDQQLAITIANKLSKIARRKNIKFYLETLFVRFYPKDTNINYTKIAHITKNNKADIVLSLEPPPKNRPSAEEFKDELSAVMDKESIPYAFLPQGEMKDSDALNLMLDIAICAKKRKK